jgi:photosystem II stability/assembly factor-like uncharacterized protein
VGCLKVFERCVYIETYNSGLLCNFENDAGEVIYSTMKKIIVILIMFAALSVNGQWTTYQTNTSMDLYKIQFVNANTGFAAGGGTFYSDSAVFFKTTNEGTSWTKHIVYDSTVPTLREIYGLYFINPNTGFVCGRYLDIYRTTNNGENWVAATPP